MICHDNNIIVVTCCYMLLHVVAANCRFSWGLHNTHYAIASTTNDFDNLKDKQGFGH